MNAVWLLFAAVMVVRLSSVSPRQGLGINSGVAGGVLRSVRDAGQRVGAVKSKARRNKTRTLHKYREECATRKFKGCAHPRIVSMGRIGLLIANASLTQRLAQTKPDG